LKRTRLDGTAAPVVVCKVDAFLGGAWTEDGRIVFGSANHGLQQVDADGGAPQPLSTVDTEKSEIDHHAPAMLPGGRAMLVTVHEGERRFRVDVLMLGSGARRTVIDNGFDARFVPTGHIVYAAGTALFAAPFHLTRLERSGPPVQLLDRISTDRREGHALYGISNSGTLVFLPMAPPAARRLVWVDRTGNTTAVPLDPREYWTPRLSPDGRRFAVVVRDEEFANIWIRGLDNGTFSRLTSEGRNWAPVWSRDGSHLIYASERNGGWHVVREALDARAAPEVLLTSADNELEPGGLSADGRSLVYVERSPSGNEKLRSFDLERRQAKRIEGVPDGVFMPIPSPDGRWLAFTGGSRARVSGWLAVRPSIFVRPLADTGPVRELMEGAGYTVWSRAGNAIYFRSRTGGTPGSSEDGIFELPFDPVRGVATGPARQLFRKAFADWWGVPGFDVSADGRFLLALSDERESIPSDPNVVLHVDDELRRRTAAAGH
jgi:hypothetical protein